LRNGYTSSMLSGPPMETTRRASTDFRMKAMIYLICAMSKTETVEWIRP
jgi:hypothetical protein